MRLEIDHADGVFIAIGGKPFSKTSGNGKAVDAKGFGDGGDALIFLEIDDFNLGGVGDIESSGDLINGEKVPASRASEGNFFFEGVELRGHR